MSTRTLTIARLSTRNGPYGAALCMAHLKYDKRVPIQ